MTRPADDERLAVDLAGLRLRSPVLLAAGTAGYANELADAIDLRRVGGVVTKSITAEPRAGNETWRVAEVPGGMLNAIGLANVGADRFRDEIAPRLSAAPATVIGSIAGHSAEEYARVARMFDAIDTVPAVEVNVSCPNVADGSVFGEAPDALGRLVAALRPALARTKLIVKLPPAAGGDGPAASIVSLARAAIDAGADGLTIANTIPAMAVDPETREPLLANVTGGLSGPAVHPVIVRLVHLAHRHAARQSQVPIIAVGGVVSWRQAAEFILVGASAVQVGTATFADPRAPLKILSGLGRWVRRQGVASVMDLVGAVRLPGGAR